jgi:hypothetical protein
MHNRNRQSVLFEDTFSKPVVAKFDADGQSSDGGLILLKCLDEGVRLTEVLVEHFVDGRDPERVVHSYHDLFRQRVYGIALGYEDCNDAERIGGDPCLKMACDRSPLDSDDDLGSQPTLSRFENSQDGRAVVGAQRELESHVIKRLAKRRRRAKLVTIDLDPSCDPTHGQQQFTFFHGKYDTWCYLPQYGFLSIDDEPEQYLFHTRLRPGNVRCYRGAIPLLRRVVPQIRKRFPKAKVRVRLDGGFANPGLFDVLEELNVQYLVAMPGNSVLHGFAEPWMQMVRTLSERSGETETLFGEASYKARSWGGHRRVIIKAEVVRHPGRHPKDNQRFVITNLRHSPENVYKLYRLRGDAENRIKEMQDLESDRTSCTRFLANQIRLIMTATAYVLYQELRWRLRHTEARRAQVGRLRIMLMKIGTRVVESVRRFVLHFPHAHPWKDLWWSAARAVGAAAG